MDALYRLEAFEHLRQLKARYFRTVDMKQWDELKTLFTPDATLHFVELTEAPEPVDKALRGIQRALKLGVVSVHHGHTPELHLIDETHAAGIWPMDDRLYFPASAPNAREVFTMVGYGYYHETYLRTDEDWRIQSLRLERLHFETRAGPS